MGNKKKKDLLLKVKIFWTPATGKKHFEGEVEAISSQNQLGRFDILPGHTNFITFVFKELVLHSKKGKEKNTFYFERGVLEVSGDRVNIFLGL